MFAFKLVEISDTQVKILRDPLDDDDKDRVLSSEQYKRLKALMPKVVWYEVHGLVEAD